MLTWCKPVDLFSETANFRKTRPTGFCITRLLSMTVAVVDENEGAWARARERAWAGAEDEALRPDERPRPDEEPRISQLPILRT